MTVAIKENQKQCVECGKVKSIKLNFYQSDSNRHFDSLIPYCKVCLKKGLDESDDKSIHETLTKLNKPYVSDAWQKAVENPKETLGTYLSTLNIPKYKGMTYFDGEMYGSFVTTTSDEDNEPSNEKIATEYDKVEISPQELTALASFWGRGYTREDLITLQSEYEEWTNRYECDSKGMELLIKQICVQVLDIENRRANGEKVDTQLKTLQDLLGSSNLKPVQETGANAVEQESFGTLIKKYENERPIPEPDEKWKDVDKIGKYIRVFFLGHLARMLNLNNQYKDEYWEEVNQYTVQEPVNEDDEEGEEIGRD